LREVFNIGRYFTGDIEGKFWFASQPSSDMLEYGHDRSDGHIQAVIYHEELKEIKDKVATFKAEFKKNFKMTYKKFMSKMNKKGYMTDSNDKETKTKKWGEMCREASRIELGDKVITALIDKKDDLYVECEC